MKNFLKKLVSKFSNGVIFGIGFVLSVGIFGIIYAWTTLDPNDAASGKPLTSTLMQGVINNINELNNKFGVQTEGKMCTSVGGKVTCNTLIPSTSDCVGANIGTSCGGGKYAGGGIVAMTSDITSSAWNTAVTACLARTDGGFTDWRLPTLDELYILYINNASIGNFNITNHYWSSIQYSTTNARYFYFSGGINDYIVKTTSYAVRCVRKF